MNEVAPKAIDYLITLESDSGVMEKLKHSEFSPAGEMANERLIEAVLDPDLYPEGTTFVAADQEGFDSALAEAVAEHRPLAIAWPDGREIVATPRGGALAFLERLLGRRRESKGSVQLPADYRVEIRGRRTAAA